MIRKYHGLALGVLTLTLASLGATAPAQDRDQQNDQGRQEQAQHEDQGARDETRRDEHARASDVERYRKAHPHAAARCHDGFFTNTTNRARACSKHGGIDVWLRPG
ncbi:MAG TPA: DUF3761 domain-containing protein [Steroidobacteraceae bacterium]|nr:DUF3761 domain-containing protein [Steroidobacteraceae bacterium]